MKNTEDLIAGILTKYSKGETLTKEDSALVDKLRETSEEKQLVGDLAKDQPWQDEEKQDLQSVSPKELWDKLKKFADKSKKVEPGSAALNRLRDKWLGIIVIIAIAALVFGLKLYNKTVNRRPFTRETDGISGTNNGDRTLLSGADGSMVAIDTMARGSQIRLSDSSFIRKIDTHSWKLCGLEIGRMGKALKLEVGKDLKFINLLYPDESRVTLELHAIYKWSSYRNPAHPDSVEGGKARFGIAKNNQSPWTILLSDGSVIKDLGTCFEIDTTITRAPKVSLVSGAVMIKASKRTVVLHPREQAIIKNGEPVVSPLAVDTALWIWAKEPLTFNFKNTSLDQTVHTIANYYRVVVHNPNHVQGIPVTAPIPTSKGLDFICKRITEIQSSTAYLRMSADSIYITDRKP